MADFEIHISQAKHNEEVAKKLVNEPPYHDWGITAAFYAAIHYFEAWLYLQPEQHTETSIPIDEEGKLKYTPHAWREELIKNKLNEDAFESFRKLRVASETARYLSFFRKGTKVWISKPASEFFTPQEAQKLVNAGLETFKNGIKIPVEH